MAELDVVARRRLRRTTGGLALILAASAWLLALTGHDEQGFLTGPLAAGILVAVAAAPPSLALAHRSSGPFVAGLWLLAGAMLSVAALWMTLEGHLARRPLGLGDGWSSLWPRILVPSICVGVSWALVVAGLRRSGRTLIRGALVGGLIVGVAPCSGVLTTWIGGDKPLMGARLVDAYLRPPGEDRMARYLQWYFDGEDERLFDASVEDWRDHACLGSPSGCPLPPTRRPGDLQGVLTSCSAMSGTCTSIQTHRYDAPPLVGSRALLVDWVVVTDLTGRFRSLQAKPSPVPLYGDAPAWGLILTGIAGLFLLLWRALFVLLRLDEVPGDGVAPQARSDLWKSSPHRGWR